MAPKRSDYGCLTILLAALGLVGGFIVYRRAGIEHPYHLVRASFSYANHWADANYGAWLKRVFQLAEWASVARLGLFAWGAFMMPSDLDDDAADALPVLLFLGLLPFVPFVWAFVSTFGWPAAADTARLVN